MVISSPFEVIKLNCFDDLSRILYPHEYSSLSSVENSHCWYFWHDYLGEKGLMAQFAVVEKNYVSKDYLDSYRDYYASCFYPIERNCVRIHFFRSDMEDEGFQALFVKAILSDDDESVSFWERDYLGFTVIKPTPQFNIGFTALKHYNYDEKSSIYKKSRNFWGTREYNFNIFGRKIRFETLPFQEQDTNLAACASVAIWTMLQVPSTNNFITLKSPGQITNDADLISNDGNRLFPNDGLTVNQMCTAITKSGLVTEREELCYFEEIDVNNDKTQEYRFENLWLKLLVRAYSSLKIPLILCMGVPEKDADNHLSYDGHAVAICGHEEVEVNRLSDEADVSFFAEKIQKLYVHDDDFGPYARMEFIDMVDGLSSAWGTNLETGVFDKRMPCKPTSLIISIYPEIRVRYSTVHDVTLLFNFIFKITLDADSVLEWDIRLQKHENWKEEFKSAIQNASVSNIYKLKILTTQLPKYLWVATCRKDNMVICDILFDTTAMRNSMLAINIVFYDLEFESSVSKLINDEENYVYLSGILTGYHKQYILFLKKFFKNENANYWYSKTNIDR